MPLVFHSQGVGKPILVEDLNAKYGLSKVGRWAKDSDGEIPDRCDYCPLIDIKPAIGFVLIDGWRHGYCIEHKPAG